MKGGTREREEILLIDTRGLFGRVQHNVPGWGTGFCGMTYRGEEATQLGHTHNNNKNSHSLTHNSGYPAPTPSRGCPSSAAAPTARIAARTPSSSSCRTPSSFSCALAPHTASTPSLRTACGRRNPPAAAPPSASLASRHTNVAVWCPHRHSARPRRI